MLYASPVWSGAAYCHIRRLQVLQNKCLKIILNLPYFFSTNRLHAISNIFSIKQSITEQNIKFLANCMLSENTFISNLPVPFF